MKKYRFRPYDPSFPLLFEAERRRILSHLRSTFLIEPIGSTAVPGLGGKGVIDIALAIDQADHALIKQQLIDLGYHYRADHSTPEHAFLIITLPDLKEGDRLYHLHLFSMQTKSYKALTKNKQTDRDLQLFVDSALQEWLRLIAFRDYLRLNQDASKAYEAIKRKSLEDFGEEKEAYRAAKDPYIQQFLSDRAKAD